MRRVLALLTASTAPLAALAGAWSGLAITGSAGSSSAGLQAAVAATASSEIATLNTFSASSAATDVQRWLGATSGALNAEIAASATDTVDRVGADGASARGTVTDLAFTSFDPSAATANVIAAVRVDVVPKTGAAASDRRRLAADLSRTAAGWRLTSLTAIPAGAPPSADVGANPVLSYTASVLGKVFSYSPDSPPSAGPELEGTAADQYRAVAGGLVSQIRAQGLTLTTHVVAAGFTSQGSDSAQILAFVDQTSTRNGGSPTVAAGAVAVTLRLLAGRWRIVSLTAE